MTRLFPGNRWSRRYLNQDRPADEVPGELALLTRDLAHQVNVLLKDEWHFPNLLRNILLVRMDSASFSGSLDVSWCV